VQSDKANPYPPCTQDKEPRKVMSREKLKGTDFQKKIEAMVWRQPPPGKWCAINSIRNLSKAWEICDIDPEMAYFRCACAEEEAAKALFHSLKRLKYEGAEKLGLNKHWHKYSVVPFIWAMKKKFKQLPNFICDLHISVAGNEGEERLEVNFKIPGIRAICKPIPPLHFRMQENNKPYLDFWKELQSLPEMGNAKIFITFLHSGAKNRSSILYAHNDGIPTIRAENAEEFIQKQLKNITEILTLYLLIDPYKEHQYFVQQCLSAFLKVLDKIPADFDPEV
jgi:hypothetical protein